MLKVKCLKLHGDVQGVNLRFNIQQYVQKTNLKGWVRNESDGSVLCCLDCSDQEIKDFISWLKDNFRITSTDIEEMDIDAEYNGFEIRY